MSANECVRFSPSDEKQPDPYVSPLQVENTLPSENISRSGRFCKPAILHSLTGKWKAKTINRLFVEGLCSRNRLKDLKADFEIQSIEIQEVLRVYNLDLHVPLNLFKSFIAGYYKFGL